MNDIYKTPESVLENSEIEADRNFELYKISAVGIATFFGTILAGGLILSMNYRKLGKEAAARNALIFSAIATAVIMAIAFLIPEDLNIPNFVFTIVQLVAMMQIAKSQQERDINDHIENGGAVASNWKAFGISLLVLLVVMALIFSVAFVAAV